MNINYDIQKIEKELSDYIKRTGISKNIFEGQRPSNIDVSMSDFVVVSVPSNVMDMAAYGRCTSRLEIFVKNRHDGLKNSMKFSIIYKKLCNTFPIDSEAYLFDIHPSMIQLGNDKNGYFVQAININTIIKNT